METSERTVVVFRVEQDGKIGNVRLSKSSSIKEVDDAALAAIALPSPPTPPSKATYPIDIQFTFDCNVLKQVAAKGKDNEGWGIINRWFDRVHQSPTAENHIGLAQAYMQAKMYQNAEGEFQAAVDLDPKNPSYKALLEKCLDSEYKQP